jgi:hypothetical protein
MERAMNPRLNKSMMTNRRCIAPLIVSARSARTMHAQPLFPAAVAYLFR